MASERLLGVLLLLITTMFFFSASDAFKPRPIRHYVNGRQGWVVHPYQDYNQWAGSHRFLVNDTLYFRYNEKDDSVLEVNEQDYESCNTRHPIMKEQGGESEITLSHSGAFYFISGNKTRCDQGEKMIVKVLSYPTIQPTPPLASAPLPPRHGGGGHHHHHPVNPPSFPPTAAGPTIAKGPTYGPVAPATSPSSGSAMSPGSGYPGTHGPAMSPSTTTSPPAMSPGSAYPGTHGPATSPSTATSPARAPVTPGPSTATSPTAASPATSPSTATSPTAASPATSPSAGVTPATPGSPATSPASSPGEKPAEVTAPGPASTKSSGVRVGRVSGINAGVLSVVIAFIMWI